MLIFIEPLDVSCPNACCLWCKDFTSFVSVFPWQDQVAERSSLASLELTKDIVVVVEE
jgi:hypothetical protein